jgi:hypothetical protein
MSHRAIVPFCFLAAISCARSPSEAALSVPSESVSAAPPKAPAPRLETRGVRCGYGGVGPSAPGAMPDAWLVAIAEVEAFDGPIEGVSVSAIELRDEKGAAITVAMTPFELAVVPPGRPDGDYSQYGTTKFSGNVAPGARLRLWIHAPLDRKLAVVAKADPKRVHVELVDAKGRRFSYQGTLDPPWPTG